MTKKPLLHINLSFRNLFLLLFFFFLMHEIHELAHIITGRIICGCWGTRDFNVWDLCTNCLAQNRFAIIATFAGPLFTFAMLWIGRYLIKNAESVQYRSLGLVFILGNMQFGRMYMAAMGGGDEVWGMRFLFLNHNHSNASLIRLITFIIVSAICLPPLITAFKTIANKYKIALYAGFLIVPLILDTVVILILLNGLLQKGILNQVLAMGTPVFINIWFMICLIIVGFGFKSLLKFAENEQDPKNKLRKNNMVA
jgi:hypothetical protein